MSKWSGSFCEVDSHILKYYLGNVWRVSVRAFSPDRTPATSCLDSEYTGDSELSRMKKGVSKELVLDFLPNYGNDAREEIMYFFNLVIPIL